MVSTVIPDVAFTPSIGKPATEDQKTERDWIPFLNAWNVFLWHIAADQQC